MKSVAMLVVACAAVTTAMAQPAKQGQPIAAQGTLPSVAVCIGCHGAKGEGMGAFPRLAGTGQAYLLAQLDAFANGDRKNPVMLPIAQSLKPAERQALVQSLHGLRIALRAIGPAGNANWPAGLGT